MNAVNKEETSKLLGSQLILTCANKSSNDQDQIQLNNQESSCKDGICLVTWKPNKLAAS